MSFDDMSVSIRFGDSQLSIEDSDEDLLRRRKLAINYWNLEQKPAEKFITDSTYKGTWNTLGMHGTGKYNFFYGPIMEGSLFDNMFNGCGTLRYPNKGRMEGVWEKGRMISHRYLYPDDMCFGPYCEMPDRSFILERRSGLKPAGRSLKTNSFQPREISEDCYDTVDGFHCYDTVDGFYDSKRKYIFHRNDHKHVIRIPTRNEHFWILKHCRKVWTEPVGFRPDLYENWYNVKKVTKERKKKKDVKEKFKRPAKAHFQVEVDVNDSDPASVKKNFTI